MAGRKPAGLTRPRREVTPIKVWVSPEEKAALSDRAAETGLSASAYLRAAGLNHPVRSVVDLQAVAELGRVNGDLGRVAGLLKLWLLEKRGQGAPAREVEALMRQFRALQAQVLDLMGSVVRDR